MHWRRIAVAGGLLAAILSSASALPAAAGSGHLEAGRPGKFDSAAATGSAYPCQAPFGSLQIPGSAWAGGLTSTGHDGATFDVYSNYRSGRSPSACAGDWVSADGTNQWGLQYQCTELAVRVADAEWATGNWAAWTNAGWNGAADSMSGPGQRLGLTWTGNGTGSLPVPGDLMIWSSSGGADPGHVAVVSAVTSGTVTFVGENQGAGMVTLSVSGTTVENNGWKSGSSILGWLSHGAVSTSLSTPNLLSNASFELGGYSGWNKCNLAGSVNLTAYSNPAYAREGGQYAEMNTAQASGSVCQDVAVAPAPGQSYVFSVWLRTPPGVASFSGTLTLWALGGTQESGLTNFTVGPAWSLVSAPVDIANTGHTALRAEIYMSTTGTNLDADAASLAAGNAQTQPADPWPPRASLGALPGVTLHQKLTITWSGTDLGSGIQSYDLRWRHATYNRAFTPWRYPAAWQRTKSTSGSLNLTPGTDYCLQVRARDNAGNLSRWSPQQCATRPLDDRALTAGPGWSRRTSAGYYLKTYTQTTRYHRHLTFGGARLQQFGLLATRCPTCGTVVIYLGRARIGTISLHATSTRKEQIIMLPPNRYQTQTITIVTISTGKIVQIDGLIASRT